MIRAGAINAGILVAGLALAAWIWAQGARSGRYAECRDHWRSIETYPEHIAWCRQRVGLAADLALPPAPEFRP